MPKNSHSVRYEGPLCTKIVVAGTAPRRGTPFCNRRGCSSEILNLTPRGDQSGRDLSKF